MFSVKEYSTTHRDWVEVHFNLEYPEVDVTYGRNGKPVKIEVSISGARMSSNDAKLLSTAIVMGVERAIESSMKKYKAFNP